MIETFKCCSIQILIGDIKTTGKRTKSEGRTEDAKSIAAMFPLSIVLQLLLASPCSMIEEFKCCSIPILIGGIKTTGKRTFRSFVIFVGSKYYLSGYLRLEISEERPCICQPQYFRASY